MATVYDNPSHPINPTSRVCNEVPQLGENSYQWCYDDGSGYLKLGFRIVLVEMIDGETSESTTHLNENSEEIDPCLVTTCACPPPCPSPPLYVQLLEGTLSDALLAKRIEDGISNYLLQNEIITSSNDDIKIERIINEGTGKVSFDVSLSS